MSSPAPDAAAARSWDEKLAIVEESHSPRASVAAIARKHGIGTGQLYTWRHQLARGQLTKAPYFARVALAGESANASGAIEIVLPDRTAVRINGEVDERALRRVLAVLRDP